MRPQSKGANIEVTLIRGSQQFHVIELNLEVRNGGCNIHNSLTSLDSSTACFQGLIRTNEPAMFAARESLHWINGVKSHPKQAFHRPVCTCILRGLFERDLLRHHTCEPALWFFDPSATTATWPRRHLPSDVKFPSVQDLLLLLPLVSELFIPLGLLH